MEKTKNYVIIILAAIAIFFFIQNRNSNDEVVELKSRSELVKDSLQAIIDSSDNNIANQRILIDSLDERIIKDDSLLGTQKIKYNAIETKFIQEDSDTSFNFIVHYLDSISARRDGTIERSLLQQ